MLQERYTCIWVGWEEKHWVRICAPGRGPRGKGRLHRQTVTLGSEWVEPQTGYPNPGVLCVGDKPVWLIGKALGQIDWRSLDSTPEECAGAGLPPGMAEKGP